MSPEGPGSMSSEGPGGMLCVIHVVINSHLANVISLMYIFIS
jgi:hypothetical protein